MVLQPTGIEISGVTDYKMPDDATCLKTIRDLVSRFGPFETAGLNREKTVPPPGDRDP